MAAADALDADERAALDAIAVFISDCLADPVGLGRKPQQTAVGVERIASTRLYKLEAGLFAAIDEALADTALHSKYDVKCVGAKASDPNDFSYAARIKPF